MSTSPTHGPTTVARTPGNYGHWINGAAYDTDETLARHAPATGELLANVAAGDAKDVAAAVTAARTTFDRGVWREQSGLSRAAALHRLANLIEIHSERLATLDAEEAGKPLRIAEGDLAGAASLTRYAASLASNLHGSAYTDHGPDFTGLVLREPIGVVGLITPWNFPVLILCQKLPFALAAGCSAVVKPSEFTTGSTLQIARLAAEAGIPDGVVNVVTGDGRAGQALAEHPDVDAISFTGSTRTGRRVLQASTGNLKKVSLELGGKAASIVFRDADLQDAADGVVFGAFFNNGECCVSQSRLLVDDAVADEFLDEVASRTRNLRVGSPLDRRTDVSAMIHARHMDSVLQHVQSSSDDGASVLVGGRRLTEDGLGQGNFVAPTILDGVDPRLVAFREEIFGPVLTVTRFSDVADAIALANSVDYGLSNSLWSKDIDKVMLVAKALRSGTVYVNTAIDAPPTLPFGGYKASGTGREMGEAGLEEFTELKSVSIRTGKRAGSFILGGAHTNLA